MAPRIASLALVCALLAADRPANAGGIHILYRTDAPEKLAASNVRYYDGVLNLEHNHPNAFALDHPFYTKMFEDPAMMDRLVGRWEAHEQRFEYWHDCLWKVLDGYTHTPHGLHSASPIPAGFPSGLREISSIIGGGTLTGGADLRGINPAGSPGGTGGGGIVTFSVPEPSSGVLMVLGLAVAAWAITRHHLASGSRHPLRQQG